MNVQAPIEKPARRNGPLVAQLPADFVEHADESNKALMERYNVGNKVLARWRKEAGVPAKVGALAARARWGEPQPAPSDFKDHAFREANRKLAQRFGVGDATIKRWRKETGCTAPIKSFGGSAQLPKTSVPAPPAGEASEACMFLRPTHRPVYHRVIEGKQYKGQYVVGTMLLTEPELMAYAREKGFKTGMERLNAFAKYD